MSESIDMKVARAFAGSLRDAVSAEQIVEIVKRNGAEEAEGVCHSHDFCDANECMAEGFKKALGRDVDLVGDADFALWGRAWSIAKHNGFWFGKPSVLGDLQPGVRVMLRQSQDRFNGMVYKAGLFGVVAEHREGFFSMKFEQDFPELKEWDNCLEFVDDYGDVADAVVLA